MDVGIEFGLELGLMFMFLIIRIFVFELGYIIAFRLILCGFYLCVF